MKTWPSLDEYEKGYYLKGNKAKVTNLKKGEMESVFELDDSSDKDYSLRDFSFDSYALYVNQTVMNLLADDKGITFAVLGSACGRKIMPGRRLLPSSIFGQLTNKPNFLTGLFVFLLSFQN